METTVTKTPKKASYREGSKMDFLVKAFTSGMTKIEDLANAMKVAEEAGTITGLKKTGPEVDAKKTLSYYKKTVNWYLNQAKHKKFINAPITPRKKGIIKEVLAAQPEVVQEVAVEPAQEVAVDTSDSSMIPTI